MTKEKNKFENVYLDQNDDVSSAVEKILETQSDGVVIFVPEEADIGNSVLNFRLILREAKAAQKEIFINSEDKKIINNAEKAGLTVLEQRVKASVRTKNPSYFRDIAPPKKIRKSDIEENSISRQKSSKSENPTIKKSVANFSEDSGPNLESLSVFRRKKPANLENEEKSDFYVKEETIKESDLMGKKRGSRRNFGWIIGFAVLVLVFLGALIFIFSSAKIEITSAKTNWEKEISVLAGRSFSGTDFENFKIPAEFLKLSRQASADFSSTGQKDVSSKSSGKIKIYNAFSSANQQLVAGTRFISKEGKLFRLNKGVVVPGAKVEDGKIIPSFLEAEISADQPGESYNVPAGRFSLPGFQGTSKYDKFYGESSASMSGGFSGMAKVISQSDLDGARKSLIDSSKISLEQELSGKIVPGIKVLDDAKVFSAEKMEFSGKVGDKADSFKASSLITLKVMAFKEETIKNLFSYNASKSVPELGGKELIDYKFNFGLPRVDFEKGLIAFPVSGKMIFREKINLEGLNQRLSWMKGKNAANVLNALPGIESVSMKLSPGFLPFLPPRSGAIKITVD